MAHNRGTRRNPDWCGVVSYKGKRKWVGGCASLSEYNAAAEKARTRLIEEQDKPQRMPTVAEFAGAELLKGGRIKMVWPDGSAARRRQAAPQNRAAPARKPQAVPARVLGEANRQLHAR